MAVVSLPMRCFCLGRPAILFGVFNVDVKKYARSGNLVSASRGPSNGSLLLPSD